jgi:UDP-glucose 4-epimerase
LTLGFIFFSLQDLRLVRRSDVIDNINLDYVIDNKSDVALIVLLRIGNRSLDQSSRPEAETVSQRDTFFLFPKGKNFFVFPARAKTTIKTPPHRDRFPHSGLKSKMTFSKQRSLSNISHDARVLVTGGAGYIGSHTTLRLLQYGYKIIVVDNLCNSYKESIRRIRNLAKCQRNDLIFIQGSVEDKRCLQKIFDRYNIVSVIHFAGLKSVSDSIKHPLVYYRNNVSATSVLLETMQKFGCHRIVFSSSATVYGNTQAAFVNENAPTVPQTPYGRSKLMCEDIIIDACNANPNFNAAILRYFNPVGCHESGLIGENPRDAPNNLMPCIVNAIASETAMNIFGDDYDTRDGSAIRDYIHVCDLAEGHVAALRKLEASKYGFCQIYNMGNGHGATVKELVATMEHVTGLEVPHIVVARRAGDAECVVADPLKAFEELDWKPELLLEDMCLSAWKWKCLNPTGYVSYRKTLKQHLQQILK